MADLTQLPHPERPLSVMWVNKARKAGIVITKANCVDLLADQSAVAGFPWTLEECKAVVEWLDSRGMFHVER